MSPESSQIKVVSYTTVCQLCSTWGPPASYRHAWSPSLL